MAQNLLALDFSSAVQDLAAMGPALNTAAQRFARNVGKVKSSPSRAGPVGFSSRLPGPPMGRVRPLPLMEPRRLRTQIPTTVLRRQRAIEALRRGGPPPLEAAVQQGAQRVANAIRSKLVTFRSGLQGVESGLQLGTSLLDAAVGGPGRRSPPSNSAETLVMVLALVVSAFVTVGALRSHAAPLSLSALMKVPTFTRQALDFPTRVDTVAHAIAVAEGYYAPGQHDGHSLPFVLKNPGSLKRPALGGENLETWQDTGLLVFPNEFAGWSALKHQVTLMLTGQSSVYRLSDTISEVASKYADGDANWGKNVARELHVSPTNTLAELVGPGTKQRPIIRSLEVVASATMSASDAGN